MQRITERARTYLARIVAISGERGHAATYSAAVALVKGFDLPEDTALSLLTEWNLTNANPPWKETDLRHKLKSAAKANHPRGYLLNKRERNPLAGRTSRPAPVAQHGEDAATAAKRAAWPVFHQLRTESLQAIADLRHLPLTAVWLAHEAGFLRGAMVDGQRCFVLREGYFAQARRFDGQPLRLHDGREVKAKNLPGSRGSFIGAGWLGGRGITGGPPPVLLVEGAIGLLEAPAAAYLTGADAKGWAVLAATSASARFEEDLLTRLAGRRVRIVPDADAAGMDAAGVWTAHLRRAGCHVDAIRPPAGSKDLGEVIANPNLLPFLSQIFLI
jgi:hypothetical protein